MNKSEIPFNREAMSQAVRDIKANGEKYISRKKEKEILAVTNILNILN